MKRPILFRITTILLILFIIFTIDTVAAQPEESRPPEGFPYNWYTGGPYNSAFGPAVNFFFNNILKLIGWYNIGGGWAPKYFFAEPAVVEIDYLENISVDIVFGSDRREASGYQKRVYDEVTLVYDVEFPPDVQESAWNVYFDPPVMDLREYTENYEGNASDIHFFYYR